MAILKKIEIRDFRGFFNKQTITFAIPDKKNKSSGLTLIVGPNNTGKTTTIEALLLNESKKITEAERHKNKQVKITITSDNGSCTYTSTEQGSQINKDGKHNVKFECVQSRRNWQSHSNATWDITNFAEQSIIANMRNSTLDTPAVLHSINKNQEEKDKFNLLMKKLVPDFSNWTIETSPQGDDYVKYLTGSQEHQANFLGDGVISLFRICAHLVGQLNDRVLLIDEPELSLHPTTQKALAHLLSKKAYDRQIILCTNSPYFAKWENFVHGAKFIRLNKTSNNHCKVFSLDNNKTYKTDIAKQLMNWQKPQLLDTVAKEILFSEKILFVEGQEDVGLIKKWLKKQDEDELFDIFGYGVGGYGNMESFLEIAQDLGLPKVAVLYDNGINTFSKYDTNRKLYSTYHFEILPTPDIRDKIDDKTGERIKEGIFDTHGDLEDVYKSEFENIMNEIINYFKS
ncbi:MAG: ATP-dependent endonuclease [Gammaproteobacteria bacterium]